MRPLLVDFLNHGILPFVGRSADADRIFSFWRESDSAAGLRAALVLGEAGIGKSRLTEEIIPRVTQSGGAVIHAKLYPDSASSLSPLLAHALHSFTVRRTPLLEDDAHLLQQQPNDALSQKDMLTSVIASLRRVARLRPTLLIIEDIHLLDGRAVTEFSTLLDALSDELLSVLCFARPVTLTAQGVLERHLVMTMNLQGLKRDYLETIWCDFFEHPPEPETLDTILNVTMGNPLALRSALRGAIHTGVLAHDHQMDRWRVTVANELFVSTLQRHVMLLSEGMAAHLDPEEFEAACRLAHLGEVFAPEAAWVLLPGNEEMIEALMFKGVLAMPTITPAPLPGRQATSRPLAFTHTLLHRQLIESAPIEPSRLLEVIAPEHVLYSTLPFLEIASNLSVAGIPAQDLVPAIDYALQAAWPLHLAGDNQIARQLVDAADRIFDHIHTQIDSETATLLRVRLLRTRLQCMDIREDMDLYRNLTLTMLELADAERMPEHHLMALAFLHTEYRWRHDRICRETLEQIERHVDAHPHLLASEELVTVLERIASNGIALIDAEVVRRVDTLLHRLLEYPATTPQLRRKARFSVFPFLLLSYQTAEDVARREEFIQEIGTVEADDHGNLLMMKLSFLLSLGRFCEALKLIDEVLPFFEKKGIRGWITACQRYRYCIRMAYGASLDETLEAAERLCRSTMVVSAEHFRDITGAYLLEFGMMSNQVRWAWETARTFARDLRYFCVEARILASLAGLHNLADISESEFENPGLYNVVRMAIPGDTIDPRLACASAIEILRTPLLRIDDILTLRSVIQILDITEERWTGYFNREELSADIHTALLQALEYLSQRSLYTFMEGLLDVHGKYLSPAEATYWRNRTETFRRNCHLLEEQKHRGKVLHISMVGTIQAQWEDGEVIQIRGARLRALLGVLVADALLDETLSPREFSYIVTEIPDENERSRKMLNGIVHRLRDALGHDTIVTGDGNPKLNHNLVRIDLLETRKHLRQAGEALRSGSLLRARTAILDALHQCGADIPFPGMYDDFFEALRADHEHEMRTGIIRIAQQLLREGDPESACEILRAGCNAMPEDEEISELLCQALVPMGRRTEAQRIRMRAVVEV